MGLFGKRNWFNYVGEVPDKILEAIISTVEESAKRFGILDLTDGKSIVTKVYEITEEILKTGVLPSGYEEMEDVAVALGVLYGHALCTGQGWSWKSLGDSAETATSYVVSPKGNFSHAPMSCLMRILSGQNDNNMLFLYDMFLDIDKKPEKQKYFLIE